MLSSVQLQTAMGDILLSVNPFKSLPIWKSGEHTISILYIDYSHIVVDK